jgi:hypothetical protein
MMRKERAFGRFWGGVVKASPFLGGYGEVSFFATMSYFLTDFTLSGPVMQGVSGPTE